MSQDIDAKAQAELVERLDSHMGQADMGEVLRDCRLARDVITTLTAERDAAIALNNKYAWERDKAREERDAAERRSEAHWKPRLEASQALVQSMREALEQIVDPANRETTMRQLARSALAQVKP